MKQSALRLLKVNFHCNSVISGIHVRVDEFNNGLLMQNIKKNMSAVLEHSFLTFHWKRGINVVDPHFTRAVN
jgi:hypothetical protein